MHFEHALLPNTFLLLSVFPVSLAAICPLRASREVPFQTRHYELPDVLYKALGVCVLLIVFAVLVKGVVICLLRRDDNKAFYGQQRVLHVLLKIRSLFCVGGKGAQVLALWNVMPTGCKADL